MQLTVNNPLTIDYNFVTEDVDWNLGNQILTVGKRLKFIPQQFHVELIKTVKQVAVPEYIEQIPSVYNILTRQPIFSIEFDRPKIKIVVLRSSTEYIVGDPRDYPLDHPFFEMQDVIGTIKDQIQHKRIGNTGLTDKEIYYYMLANALEHAKNGKPFSLDCIVKPMLVYKQNPDYSMQIISLLPSILNIPELNANIGGIFSRLLTAKGTSESAVDLLGVIVSEEGGRIDVGRLTIAQQYWERKKIIWQEDTSRNMCGKKKTTIVSTEVTERGAIEHTGKLKAVTGDWDINLIEFHARGGSIVCLDGDTSIRVRDIVEIYGLLGVHYEQHTSSARTMLNKRSTKSFVQRQHVVPFRIITPKGGIKVLCDGEIYAQALTVLADHGYIYSKNMVELDVAKLWQQMGPTHTKKGMMLSTSHGGWQTAVPCTFVITNNMLIETSATGAYQDTGSQFTTGSGVVIKEI